MSDSAGFSKEILKEGDGPQPKSGDRLKMHYTGTLEDGTKFDSSYDRNSPFEFQIGVGQVIRGWDEGVLTMKVGEKARLTIQPEYGYGSSGVPQANIPPHAVLIFDVELLSIGSQSSSSARCNLL